MSTNAFLHTLYSTLTLTLCVYMCAVSAKLSTLVTELDLDTRLKYKLMAHKHETERLHSLVDEEVDGEYPLF